MQELLRLTLSRLEFDPPRFGNDELSAFPQSWLAALRRRGILRAAAPAASVECRDCGLDERCRVNFITRRQGAEPEGFIHCPQCGVVRVDERRLQRWLVDAASLAQVVAEAIGCQDRPSELAPGILWRVGRGRFGGASREILLLRRLMRADAKVVREQLARRGGAIVLVPTERLAQRCYEQTGRVAILLSEVLQLGKDELSVDLAQLREQVAERTPTPTPTSPRPPRRRAGRTAKIELLEKEMIQHLRAARDHAFDTRDRTGEAALLPRPLRKDLGKMAGLEKYDVTKCFQDPQARELNLYWEIAVDLDQIMRWQGPVQRGRAS